MTTRGGSAISTTLMASPRRASLTSCAASALAWSNRVALGRRVGHAQRAVEHEHPVRPLARAGAAIAPRLSRNGLAIAETTSEDQQRPDGQQEPLLDPDPPLVLADRGQQEPHRRPAASRGTCGG